jgi:hypothetical protein
LLNHARSVLDSTCKRQVVCSIQTGGTSLHQLDQALAFAAVAAAG